VYPEDMFDIDTLMSAYETAWQVADDYEEDSKARNFIVNLIDDLDHYIDHLPYMTRPKYTAVTIFKIIASAFGIFGLGVFVTLGIEYGIDLTIGSGMIAAFILTFSAGMGAYEDIKVGE
jgi:hypothetical protein